MTKFAALVGTVALGLTLAAIAWGGAISQISTSTGKVLAVSATSDGKYVAVSTFDEASRKGQIQIYRRNDDGSWTLVKTVTTPEGLKPTIHVLSFVTCPNTAGQNVSCLLAYEPGGRQLLWETSTGEFIRVFSTAGSTSSTELGVIPGTTLGAGSGRPVVAVEGPPKGQLPRYQGTIQFVDSQGQPMGPPVPVPHWSESTDPVYEIWFAPDGSYIATVGGPESGKYYVCVLGVTAKKCDKKIQIPRPGVYGDISPYGKIVVAMSQGYGAVVIDKASGQKVTLTGSQGAVDCVFLSDGNTIACGFTGGYVRLYNTKGEVLSETSVCSNSGVSRVAKGPSNSVIVGCSNGTSKVVESSSSTPAATPTASPKPSPSPTSSPSPSPSSSPKPSSSPSPSPTSSTSPSSTPTSSPSSSPSSSPVPTV